MKTSFSRFMKTLGVQLSITPELKHSGGFLLILHIIALTDCI